jgi:signal transduction histidine kinase
MLLISAGLTGMSLFLVRGQVQSQVRRGIFADLQNSATTFESFEQQREASLTRSAELLADLPDLRALMTTQDEATIQDGSDHLWRLAGSDLMVLADPGEKIVALHTSSPGFDRNAAQSSLSESLHGEASRHWWFGDHHLYEVFVRPIYLGPATENRVRGFLAVGYEIDDRLASEVSRIAASQVAFSYGHEIIRTTLAPAQEAELARQLVADSRHRSPEELQLSDEHFLVTSVELAPGRSPSVRLIVLKSFDQATRFLDRVNRLLLALGLAAVLGGSLLVFFISDTFMRPLGSLVEGVRALERGNYDYPLDARGGDEVAEVTAVFVHMRSSLLKTQQELLEAERLATIGRMASSISHDLRHSLAAIVANTEFLCETRLTHEQREELYQEVRLAVNQMTDLIDSLLEFSRTRESLRPAYGSVRETIEHVVQVVRAHPEYHHVVVEVSIAGSGMGWFDAKKLERALYNLLLNACEAVPRAGGHIQVDLKDVPGGAEVRVIDNGRGIPDPVVQTLFEPFVSFGKENGTGLGLTVVQKIVQDHGGEIVVECSSAQGTTFRLFLPLGSPGSPDGWKRAGMERPSSGVTQAGPIRVGLRNSGKP